MNVEDDLIFEKITFNRKPEAVPFKNRISYKIMFISLLIKHASPKSGCSLEKMQIISSYYLDRTEQKKFIYMLEKNRHRILFKEDLFVVRAVNYMYSEKILKLQKDGKYRLTSKGIKLTDMIEKEHAFLHEIKFFIEIGSNFPESVIGEMKNRLA
ncbi:hypothetical protein OGZ39_11980 [Lactococcus lactis]|uniref:Uncharacterized protein n=1 Tax=Lactococcus lactis TaxID=1358 RepID=A0A9X4S4F6_9LACT|nr:hypothetical protein [Lactococcus lactis]MDG4982356.1 hypothetical protein [Lactococcus lactis]THA51331.1 hypothetical protein E5555_11095 [Lactococcus lactis]